MKKFLALVLALVMTMSLVTIGASAKTGFTDDAKINNDEAVQVLSSIGILAGYADGSFRPQGTLTRGAGAKIVAYLVLGQETADKLAATYTVFEDVTDSVGLAPYIEWAAASGIVDGYGDGNFGPYNTLTEYAFGKMLLTALGYDSEKEGFTGAGWQTKVYAKATALNIYDGTESFGACDRETAARLALGALLSHVVVYGDAALNGKYYWNGNLVTVEVTSATVKDTAIEISKTLGDFYGLAGERSHDKWGRPGREWTYNGAKVLFYTDPVLATYYTAVTECNVAEKLGISVRADYTTYTNGYVNDGRQTITASQTVNTIGAQGRLTEIYADEIVYIDTYLATVESVTARTFDVTGHVRTPAELVISIVSASNGSSTYTLHAWNSDYSYSYGERLAVNVVNNGSSLPATITPADDQWSDKVDINGDLSAVTVTVDAIVTTAGSIPVAVKAGGTTYYYNNTFAGTKLTTSEIGASYTLFLDAKGNILELYENTTDGDSGSGVVTGLDVERLAAGEYVVVAEVLQADGTTAIVKLENAETNKPYESEVAAENAAKDLGKNVLISYDDDDEDSYHDDWAAADFNTATKVARGVASQEIGLVNDNTVFFVANYSFDNGKGEYVFTGYSVIKGFKNIKDLECTAGKIEGAQASQLLVARSGNAVLVLNANKQTTPTAGTADNYAYLITDSFVTIANDTKTYTAIINGVSGQSLTVTEGTGAQINETGLYTYNKSAVEINGYDQVALAGTHADKGTYSYSAGVLKVTGTPTRYLTVADDVAVYLINPTTGASVRVALSDLSATMYGVDCDIEYQLNEYGYISLIYIVENAQSYAPTLPEA